MKRFTKRLEDGSTKLNLTITDYGKGPYPVVPREVITRLAEYEDTGLTAQEIEQMKVLIPLHNWEGHRIARMSIFGVTVSRIIELTNADKQGRIIIVNKQDIHPCHRCDSGWGSISSEGYTSCEETCIRLKEYNEKHNN